MAEKKDNPNETVTLTRADLDALIKTGVEAGLAAAEKQHRANVGLESTHATQEQRTHAILGTPIPKRECLKTTLYPCRNPRNGAEFTAIVVPSRKWKEGRVVDLIDYKYPADLAQRSGQKVHPSGTIGSHPEMIIPLVDGEGIRGPFNQEFLHWRYQQYDLADRSMFVGQSAELLPTCGEPRDWTPQETARTMGEAAVG